jgi:hypothetical protein
MRIIALVFLIALSGCRSTEVKQIVWYFWPMKVRLGTDVSALHELLQMDTTKYFVTGHAKHIKQYTLTKSALDKLESESKFLDSMRLDFYNDKLFALELFASGNPNVEHLKFGIRGGREGGFSSGSTFKHTELSYRSRDGQCLYDYNENIVDNIAVLTISNRRMLKLMPPRQRFH